ncbi:MAG TPA: GTP-binding protein [Kofleriaceae bacterium]|nr:GTP-binding protein [Kofleriaceae bacterium]
MIVPVVLLTGFLGSGKTTLLNRLLAYRQERPLPSDGKLAVLVNELGSVGIDAALLPSGAARQVELAGGCICCTLDENLAQSLTDLLDAEPLLRWVIIETTGIAEPLPIIWTLTGEALARRIRLAAVVTVVDALEHERHRPLALSVDAQVEHADVLVLSKRDALPPGDARLSELTGQLRRENPTAALLAESGPAASARALWQLLSDSQADTALARGGPAHSQHNDLSGTAHGDHTADAHAGSGDHDRAHAGHRGIETAAVAIEGTLDFEELTNQLESLPSGYLRIKGICWAVDPQSGSDEPALIAFHRVGARVSAEPIAEVSPGETVARAVALGFGIEPDRLAACLRAAMVPCKS